MLKLFDLSIESYLVGDDEAEEGEGFNNMGRARHAFGTCMEIHQGQLAHSRTCQILAAKLINRIETHLEDFRCCQFP